jgi:hypothetical protein
MCLRSICLQKWDPGTFIKRSEKETFAAGNKDHCFAWLDEIKNPLKFLDNRNFSGRSQDDITPVYYNLENKPY